MDLYKQLAVATQSLNFGGLSGEKRKENLWLRRIAAWSPDQLSASTLSLLLETDH